MEEDQVEGGPTAKRSRLDLYNGRKSFGTSRRVTSIPFFLGLTKCTLHGKSRPLGQV